MIYRWLTGSVVVTAFALLGFALVRGADTPEAPRKAVEAALDAWHQAAAAADEETYFGAMTADAVFLGTDAKERWTRDEFRTWAKPYFTKGKAWSFKAARRSVTLGKDGAVAWFDETLDTPNLGPARGTGVLVLDAGVWKIAQYHLCVPIPNETFDDVKKLIAAAAAKEKK